MTEEAPPKRPRGRPKGSGKGTPATDRRADGREKGKPLAKPLQEAKKAFVEEAERIYRRYCRGNPSLEGAYAHVVKVLEGRGHDNITIEHVKTWARKGEWDRKVADLDARTFGALEDIRARRRAASPSGRAELEAMRETIDELTSLAMDMTVKASAALEGVVVETLSDVATLARTAKDVAESAMRVREALNRYVPANIREVTATADGQPIEAEVLPPPASAAVPNLEAVVASFERGARQGQKH